MAIVRTRGKSSPWALVIAGILLLIFSCSQFAVNARNKKVCTATSMGTVTDVTSTYSRRNGRKYRATVSYQVDNMSYSVRTPARSHQFTKGENFTVNYNPSEPSKAYCPDYTSSPLISLICSLVVLAAGAFGLVKKYLIDGVGTSGY
ncbi:MAG: hypothetical protein IK046_01440 [Clostridia bacterium]|nr:hypothetical protein [Clostridia bacterium]